MQRKETQMDKQVPTRWLAIALLDLKTDPPPTLIITFIMGLLSFAVIGNFAYSIAVEPEQIQGDDIGRILLLLFVFFFIAIGNFATYLDSLRVEPVIATESDIEKMEYIISSLSPYEEFVDRETCKKTGKSNLDNIVRLIHYHQPHLKKLYLVGTFDDDPDNRINDTYEKLKERVKAEFSNVDPVSLLVKLPIRDARTSEFTFSKVQSFLLETQEVTPSNTVIDITAGTKPITVGLVLAGIIRGYPVSYQAIERDRSGRPKTEGKTVLSKLETDFTVIISRPTELLKPVMNEAKTE